MTAWDYEKAVRDQLVAETVRMLGERIIEPGQRVYHAGCVGLFMGYTTTGLATVDWGAAGFGVAIPNTLEVLE